MRNSIAMTLLAALGNSFSGLNASTMPHAETLGDAPFNRKPRKGQIHNARPKASGAAQLKRAAKKRNSIRKHS